MHGRGGRASQRPQLVSQSLAASCGPPPPPPDTTKPLSESLESGTRVLSRGGTPGGEISVAL